MSNGQVSFSNETFESATKLLLRTSEKGAVSARVGIEFMQSLSTDLIGTNVDFGIYNAKQIGEISYNTLKAIYGENDVVMDHLSSYKKAYNEAFLNMVPKINSD